VTETEHRHIFEDWLSQNRGLFFKIIRVYAFTPADRDDLFQEIAIQVWRSVPAFRQESSISTWLYRIALNTAIKWLKKEQKHNGAESLDDAHYVLVDNHVETDERLTWLYEKIHQLDEIDRSVILLLLEGFSYKEMAGILGITETNVGVKINRIKKQLVTKSQNDDHHGI
jgi:RNA polymerase sigma-70 factor, ECF subfamily